MKLRARAYQSLLVLVLTALWITASGQNLLGQESRGSIQGRVLDSGNAVVLGAEVRVTHVDKGISVQVVTNEDGNYRVPYLNLGVYRITASKAGFKSFVRKGVELRVAETLNIDIILQVGEVSQVIEVTATAPLLETATSSLGQVIDGRRLKELPIQAGNPYELVLLAPGVVNATNLRLRKAAFNNAPSQILTDGNAQYSNEFAIDGVPNTFAAGTNPRGAFSPPQSAVAEVKVQSTSDDASVGHTPGSPSTLAKKASSMTDRVRDRGRKFPVRDNRTAIEIVKHVNGIFGGLEQGAGLGFGIELTTADSIPGIEFRATMLTSHKLYRRFEGEAYIPKIGDEKTHADFWYGYLRRTKDNFFGIGAFTPLSAKTNFDVERRSVSGGLYRDFTESLQAGIYVSYINSDAYGGQSSKSPSIDTVFSNSPSVVPITLWTPGLHSGSKVITYGLFGEYDRRNYENGLTKGYYFYGRFGTVDGLDKGNGIFSDYGWFDSQFDARGYIPLFSNKTSLVVRVATDLRDPKGGSQIPFYDLSFLGGFSHVRGFNTYRYRGNNALIGNVELRQTVYSFKKEHRGLDLIGFGDAGQVWGDNHSTTDPTILGNDNFASRNWKAGIGGGVQYRHTKSLVVRFDVATSQDGVRPYFSISRGF